MTKEALNRALSISDDLSMLRTMKAVQDDNHWVGFTWSGRQKDGAVCFQSEIMQKAFEQFVNENIDRLTAEFEKI